jgi:hypothetical protein
VSYGRSPRAHSNPAYAVFGSDVSSSMLARSARRAPTPGGDPRSPTVMG